MLFNGQEERRNRQQEEYRIRFRQRATLLGIGLIFLVTAVLLIVGENYYHYGDFDYDDNDYDGEEQDENVDHDDHSNGDDEKGVLHL